MRPELAKFIREIATFFDLHEYCPFKVCRRAKACATRQVICYQAMEDEMSPIVQSVRARVWVRAVARGDKLDIPPAQEGDMHRLLEWEAREIALIAAGEYGDDDLTPYRLWLKRLGEEEKRGGGGEPPPNRPSRTGAPSSSEASLPAEEPSKETPGGSANRESAASPGRRRRPDGIAARPRR
jgi:hypothetical protein